jgi:hypothetical protein
MVEPFDSEAFVRQMVKHKKIAEWSNISIADGERTNLGSISIQPEVFTEDPGGLKIKTSPGCVITVDDGKGNKASVRVDGGRTCDDVANFIRACGNADRDSLGLFQGSDN